jgi:hypothetical protein
MGSNYKNALSFSLILVITAFSCSLPIFKGGSNSKQNQTQKKASLSGVLQLSSDCTAGYYQVKLQGILENSQIQVDTQSDASGHFTLLAPAGRYWLMTSKDECGSKDPVELQENTEHMLAVAVRSIRALDQSNTEWARIPSSILIDPKSK